jgi:hypothetical protein
MTALRNGHPIGRPSQQRLPFRRRQFTITFTDASTQIDRRHPTNLSSVTRNTHQITLPVAIL